ncbi:MAG: beta-ketoacyl-ACP synthase III [Thiohalospira sp.]
MSQPVYITRIAGFLPNEPVSSEAMEQVLGQAGDRPSRARRLVLRNNGIRWRHYVIDPETGRTTHNNAQLTAEAVRRLAGEDFSLAELDCLCCGTSSPDQLQPGHAVMVHGELGNPACEVASLSGICVSGVSAMRYAWLAIRAGEARRAVATGSEVASTYMRGRFFGPESEALAEELEARPELGFEKDFLRWMLSDGAGAVLLESRPRMDGPSLEVEWIEQASWAHELEACMYGGAEKNADGSLTGWREVEDPRGWLERSVFAVKQDVRLLDRYVVEATVEWTLPAILERRGLSVEQVDRFLPHMSSEYFRGKLAEALERIGFPIPQERWFTNLERVGNVGSASIFLMLDELWREGRLEEDERLLCFIPESGRFSSAFMALRVVRNGA